MPFTPFHWGIPYVLGEFLIRDDHRKRRFQIIGLLAATIPDIEGFLHVIGFSQIQLHGPLHSIFGSLLVGLGLLGFAEWLRRTYQDDRVTEDTFLPRYFRWDINIYEKMYIIISPFLYQVSLDMWMYPDIELFWPFYISENPLASSMGSQLMYNLGSIFLLLAVVLFIINFIRSMLKHMNLDGFEPE